MKDFLTTPFFLVVFYFLFLVQTGPAVRLGISEIFFYLILFALLLLIVFENPQKANGIVVAVFVGIMWGLYSFIPFGLHALVLGLLAFSIKTILKNYVRFLP